MKNSSKGSRLPPSSVTDHPALVAKEDNEMKRRNEEKIDLIVSINYPLAGLGGRGSVYVGLVAGTRRREYSIS
jgi:hypothetical protein